MTDEMDIDTDKINVRPKDADNIRYLWYVSRPPTLSHHTVNVMMPRVFVVASELQTHGCLAGNLTSPWFRDLPDPI